ncbi:acylphosphatase [Streptomyces sp. MUM 178J]|uniref:acylphosphatase n=1 Tax=Streptomyces sp. MUM 178J TaxID=2791991 RepID=UPI001F03A4DA|nr:acylphosphatase [Streptomyces sp. MUM 178J]WRQ79586.1 acylphosphatase [Streptomyces sp. MUM 178J]
MIVRKRVVVGGVVQGVFFRDTCRQTAQEHGVAGWVRNVGRGEVEAVFEGEEGGVEALVRWARRGPAAAVVERVEVRDEAPEGASGFEVLPSVR